MPQTKRGTKRQEAGDYGTPRCTDPKVEDELFMSPSTSPEQAEGRENGNGNDGAESFSFAGPAPSHRSTEIHRYSPTE